MKSKRRCMYFVLIPAYFNVKPRSLMSFASRSAVSITGSIIKASFVVKSANKYEYVDDSCSNS